MANAASSDSAAAARLQQYLRAAEAALRASDMQRAMLVSDEAISQGLEHPNLLTLAAHKRMHSGASDRALALLTRARELSPRNADVLGALGQCLTRLGRPREALSAFDAALRQAPRMAELHFQKAMAFEQLSELDHARREFERTVDLQPAHGEALARLAVLAAQRGDAVAARNLANRALNRDPRQGAARLALALAALGERDFALAQSQIAKLLGDANTGPVNRAFAQSLAGDVLDGEGKWAEAFAAYAASKATLRTHYAPAMAGLAETARQRVGRMTDYFRTAVPDLWRAKRDAPAQGSPRIHVFLVGFPRSGTTLLEQILASHPDVESMEERDCLIDAATEYTTSGDGLDRLATIVPEDCARHRAAYWRHAAAFGKSPSRAVFMDKMPLNTILLPLVAKLFPNAKILFALRDPRDVVLSCFRRRLGMTGQMYELFTLEGAAGYYGAVMELAQIYRDKLGLDLLETRHENLLADFEGETRRICAFLGLAWREEMKEFAGRASARNIDTPSGVQLARGLSRDGAGQWRHYHDQLAPVLPVLAPWCARFGYAQN
jgi:tetratricopeptide (TPR) repeat protein